MGTGQTILTIGAFMLLTSILHGVFVSTSNVSADVASGQDGILATTIAVSFAEHANRLAFDDVTDSSNVIDDPNLLTLSLGREAGEDSLWKFNDFDDFNGWTEDRVAGNSGRRYRTTFTVSYADPNHIDQNSSSRGFLKRLDMKTWRTLPLPLGDEQIDTLKTSIVMGYFHFE
jgi:hypothetical protein